MMKIASTLALAKELHSHSIINEDTYYCEKLLQMIINLSTIDEVATSNGNSLGYQAEINKVKRRVPKWMKKTHQYNYIILKAFMDMSNNNEYKVSVDELAKNVNIGKVFLSHYNNLKTISHKNHGKVFDEVDKNVRLWEPVATFIESIFKDAITEDLSVGGNRKRNFKEYALLTMEHEHVVDLYIKSLRVDIPTKLDIDDLMGVTDIKFLQELHDRCSINGDLHEWNKSKHRYPMAAIGKYIEFLQNQGF